LALGSLKMVMLKDGPSGINPSKTRKKIMISKEEIITKHNHRLYRQVI
jgi:hypothetical protein